MRITFISIIIFSVVISSLCTSCLHHYYAPNSNNVPLFKEKNEGLVQAQFSSGNDYEGFEFQSAYAVGKHTALQLDFFTASGNEEEAFVEPSSGKGTYIEAAGGYFAPSGNNLWVFETYAGIGTGTVTNEYYKSESSKVGVTKFFLQPSYGFSTKNFEIAISSKFSLATFKMKNSTVTMDNNPAEFPDIEFLQNNKSFFFWEPGIMMRGGFKQFKVLAQFTLSVPNDSDLNIDPANLSLGILIPFQIKQ
jgi:hypothetical protein